MYTNKLLTLNSTDSSVTDISKGAILALIILGVILVLLLSVAALYLIASLRRRNVVLKKVDYLIEDITYKSESLNVTVETVNKISNYILSLDTVTQTGFKSVVKLISENKNYIYAIIKKLQSDVENKKEVTKKTSNKKVKKTTEKKQSEKKVSASKTKKASTTKK